VLICRMFKSGRVRSEGHVARTGVKGNAYRILVGKPERGHPEDRDWVGEYVCIRGGPEIRPLHRDLQ
jgi:hypothetical protein